MQLDYKIDGLKELEQKLKKLPAVVARKSLNQALSSSANKIKNEAVNRAPGSIKKAIFKSTSFKYARGSINSKTAAAVTVGVFKSGPRGAPHAHLIEYGTKERQTKKRVVKDVGRGFVTLSRRRGRVTPRSFMRTAWRIHGKDKFLQRFKNSLTKKIDKLIK